MFEEEEAKEKHCPIYKTCKCLASECMAWTEAYGEVIRENHSGADTFMAEHATIRNQRIVREGPNNCTGTIILRAKGYCSMLYGKKNNV